MPPRQRTRGIISATALVALLIMATAALRGYLPGAQPPARRPPAADNPVALAVVIALLVAAVGVVAVTLIARHKGLATAPRTAERSDWNRDDRDAPTWRVVVITFGLILGWLVLTAALGSLGGGGPDTTPPPPDVTPPTTSRAPDQANSAADPPPQPGAGSKLLGYVSGAAVVLVLVMVAGSLVVVRIRRGQAPTPAHLGDDRSQESGPESESLARAAEVGLAEVGDPSREPRRAIIACYAAMEGELALLPDAAPRDFDTASEVLARAVQQRALTPDSATHLVDLFDEARFSPHVMDERHRDAAVAVLTDVLGELRGGA